MSNSRILAIETSCDETAAAVVENGQRVLSNVVASQTELHAQYGGVFPEVASRKHIEVIYAVIEKAMNEARTGYDDIDAVAVTRGPGLVGSLLVGVNAAKGIAVARQKPLIGINHIEGHIYSMWLSEAADEIEFPLITLVVSGGHTELYLMRDHLQYERLGGTLDDAAGEAFDKVGRLLGLPYPGGPSIDDASLAGNSGSFRFPRAVMDDEFNFSFSGLKTAVVRETRKYDVGRMPINDLAASFQAAVVDVLAQKTYGAAMAHKVAEVHLTGGVSANRELRKVMQEEMMAIPVRFPAAEYCTDNAAMIGAAAHFRLLAGESSGLNMDVEPGLRLV